MPWIEIIIAQCSFKNTFILKRHSVVNFADIIKTATIYIKATFQDSKKELKELVNYALKHDLYLYFLILQNLVIFGEKVLMSASLKRCVT